MVQPRKEQVLSPDTKFSRYSYSVSPGISSSVILETTLNPSLITQIPGGIEENIPASVVGSLDPYPILPGDGFNISIDNGASLPIIFVGTDTTATRIAAKINAAAGASVASYVNGALVITSTTTGPDSSILLSDITLATLAKMGLVAGTYVGAEAPVRGVVTQTPNSLGGFIPILNSNGEDLVTDNPSLVSVALSVSGIVFAPSQLGGAKIHGRITQSGFNYTISYFAFLAQKAKISTFNSNFSLLDGTDSITINIDGNATTVTFPSFPYTRDQVVNEINKAWGTSYFVGQAAVTGTVSQPYTFNTDGFTLAVDGGAPVTVTLNSEISANDVAATLNSTPGLTGLITATTIALGDNLSVLIASRNTNGLTSSLEFHPVGQSLVLHYLGISPGLYRGSFIATPNGASEIFINSFIRGTSSSITVSGPAQTQTRLGLTAGVYSGSDSLTEESVVLPNLKGSYNSSFAVPSGYQITALIPEVIEFGEVPPAADRIVQEFTDFSPGSNFDPRSMRTVINILHNNNGYGQGITDAGKPAVIGPDGVIDLSLLRSATDESSKLFKKFLRGNFQTGGVSALIATIIETPGSNGNPVAESPTLTIDIDPNATFPTVGNVAFRDGRDSGSPITFLNVAQGSGGPAGIPWRASGGATGSPFAWGSDFGVTNLYDPNTIASGIAASGPQVIPLTETVNAQNIRVLEQYAPGVSITNAINARETVTCGDGTNSFGDFNGPNALNQAIGFFLGNTPFVQGKIILKGGTFTVSTPISILTNRAVIIQGQGPLSTTIVLDNITVPAPQISWSGLGIEFRDLSITVRSTVLGFGQIFANAVGAPVGPFIARNCIFTYTCIICNDSSYDLDRCSFNCSFATADKAILTISNIGNAASTGPYRATNCTFLSGDNNPVLRITTGGPFVYLSLMEEILFQKCQMFLRSTTLDIHFNMVGNCGVIDVDPNGANALNAALATGVAVSNIIFDDCSVVANIAGGQVNTLLHLKPVQNGAFTSTSLYSFGLSQCIRIDNVEIRGGSWTVPALDSITGPFIICGIGLFIPGQGNTDGTLSIENTVFALSNSTSIPNRAGGPTGDIHAHFTSMLGPSIYVNGVDPINLDQHWGAIALDAVNMSLQHIKIINASQLSGCGELLVKALNSVDINDVLITDYKPGGAFGLAPYQRVRFRFGDPFALNTMNVNVRKLRVIGTNAPSSSWTQSSSGSGWSFPVTGLTIAMEPTAVPFVFENCEVRGFSIASAADPKTANLGLIQSSLGGLFGSGAGANLPFLDQLKINRFKSIGANAGIDFSLGSNVSGFNWEIKDSQIQFALGPGIAISSSLQLGQLLIANNRVIDNGVSSLGDSNGIAVIGANWPSTDSVRCLGNTSSDNFGANQITFISTVGLFPQIICYNNQCTSVVASTPSLFQAIAISVAGGPIGSFAPLFDRIRGFETAYPDFSGTRLYQNGAAMLHNLATLQTPA